MHQTIYTTPVVNKLLKAVSFGALKITGWTIEGKLPPEAEKAVLIAAPHTSNWDLPLTLMTCFVLDLNIYWLGKDTIFKPPFRGLMMWLGGLAVDRSKANNLVAASAQALMNTEGRVQLVIPPEGTRSKAKQWKTGFYYIALASKLPIVLAFMDYEKKRAGIKTIFWPTGDIEKDMVVIQAFYIGIKGKNPDQF